MLHPNTEPYIFPAGSSGCLLIHGFTGTPQETRGLGEYLHAQGHSVLGVRLAGHGSTPEALHATRWSDWFASVEEGFAALRQRCTRIAVVGFSLGGALALLLARQHSFDRLVLLSTPLALDGDWRLNMLPLVRHVTPWYYPLEKASFSDPFVRQRVREFSPDVDLDDPQVQQQIRRSVKISVAAVDELRRALKQARAALPAVRQPALIMHGREDETARPAYADEIAARIGSTEKDLVLWKQTGHQLLVVGPQRHAIYERIAAFVARPA